MTETRYAIINGRRVTVPRFSTGDDLARAGNVDPDRVMTKRTREKTEGVGPDEQIEIQDGDKFGDAPQRVKGASGDVSTVGS